MKLPNWPTIICRCGRRSGKGIALSRMPGDIAVRTSVASISTRALRSAFSMMSSVTGSMATLAKGVIRLDDLCRHGSSLSSGQVDEDVADLVDRGDAAGLDQRGGIHLHTIAGPGITSPAFSRARS
jgi:hypothetical protein